MKHHLARKVKADYNKDVILNVAACRNGLSLNLSRLSPSAFYEQARSDKGSICSHCLREFNKKVRKAKEQ